MKILLISLGFFGLIATYLLAVLRYANPPFKWIIEKNLPWYKDKPPYGKSRVEVWGPGLHFLWFPVKPFMYVRNKLNCADETIIATLGVNDGRPGGISPIEFTDSSAGVMIQIVLKVIDPLLATYAVDDYRKAAIDRIEANFRRFLSTMTLDDAIKDLESRGKLCRETFDDVNEALAGWGVAITNPEKEITILDFILSDKIIAERDKILQADKDREATIKAADANRQKKILDAQGDSEAIRLVREAEGTGEAEKVHLLAEKLKMPPEDAINYLLKLGMLKTLEGATIIATSEGGRLNAPIDLAATLFAVDDARKKTAKKEEDNK